MKRNSMLTLGVEGVGCFNKYLTFLCFFFFVELLSFSGSEISKINNNKRKGNHN